MDSSIETNNLIASLPVMPSALQQEPVTQTQKPAEEILVSYRDLDAQLIMATPPDLKTVPTNPNNPTQEKQSYHQIVLKYTYVFFDKKIVDEFYFEFCEVESKLGLMTKTNAQGRPEHSILIKFDISDSEQIRLIDALNRVHVGCANFVNQYKGIIKLHHFNLQAPDALFKNPIYYARDKMTGELLPGRAPSMYLKAFTRGQPPYGEQTLFTGLDGKPIPWVLLRSVEMKFIPLVHIKNIYCGSKASLQMEIISAVVTKIIPRGTTSKQTSTIQALQRSRPELADSLAAQLAKITSERQDQIVASQQQKQDVSQLPQVNQPTFSGITSTNQRMPQQPSSQSNYPQIPQQVTSQQSNYPSQSNYPPQQSNYPPQQSNYLPQSNYPPQQSNYMPQSPMQSQQSLTSFVGLAPTRDLPLVNQQYYMGEGDKQAQIAKFN